MKKIAVFLTLLTISLGAFASGSIDLRVTGTDLAATDSNTILFNQDLKINLGERKKFEVLKWSTSAATQKMTYTLFTKLASPTTFEAVVKAIVVDLSGAAPAELYNVQKSVKLGVGESGTIEFLNEEGAVMLNHSILIKSN